MECPACWLLDVACGKIMAWCAVAGKGIDACSSCCTIGLGLGKMILILKHEVFRFVVVGCCFLRTKLVEWSLGVKREVLFVEGLAHTKIAVVLMRFVLP